MSAQARYHRRMAVSAWERERRARQLQLAVEAASSVLIYALLWALLLWPLWP